MPHLLQEALPDTLALSACQLFGLDQVALSYTNLEGLSVHRVSGNHDNMGRFLVAMEMQDPTGPGRHPGLHDLTKT